MKKTEYMAKVDVMSGGGVESFSMLTGETAETVVAQANAEQTIDFYHPGMETEIIIPWEALVEVQYIRRTEDVEAPIDAICEEEEVKPQEGFVFVPCEGAYVSLENFGADCGLVILDPIMDVIFCDLLLDGESILDNTDYAIDGFTVDGFEYSELIRGWGKPVECGSIGAPYSVTFTAPIETPDGMESVTQTVTLPVESGGGGNS